MSQSQSENVDGVKKPRYDWYETDQTIVIGVMIKNIDKTNVDIKFEKKCLKFSYKNTEDNSNYELIINLNGEIIPEQSTYKITPVKCEIKLSKTSNYRWQKLEASSDNQAKICNQPMNSVSNNADGQTTATNQRNWDKIVKEMEKNEPEDDQGVEELFRRIYSSGDENLRRAMNKSFVESNGTVLSTNWDDVGKSKVEMKPPDSCEYRKWDS